MRMLFKTMRMVGMTVALVGSALVSSAEPIRGTSNNPGVPGVFGEHTNGVGGAAAIIGQSEGRGVLGISNIGQGVWGASESSTGVVGVSKTGFGTSGLR